MKHPNNIKHRGFSQTVEAKENRKLKEKNKSKRGIWFGLGMFGLVGWSIVVPTLLGTLLGIWLDHRFHGKESWTLTFLFIGLIIGCIAAWHWLSSENKEMHKEEKEKDE
jgi:ATP synthase protein I